MADGKDDYSEESNRFVSEEIPSSDEAQLAYARSKAREEKHNEEWLKNKVNLNEVIDKFAPGSEGTRMGDVKFTFRGDRYDVITDMASGYLRIYDREAGRWVGMDGKPRHRDKGTHFKIMTREEME